MRYSVLMLALTLAATMTPGCKPEDAGRRAQGARPSQGFQVGEEPRVGEELQVGEDPQAGQQSRGNQGSAADEEPLLLLDDEPLLLLDDGQEKFVPPTGPVADNSRCYVCHMNYMQEELAVDHAEANIGCADCHGNCDEHIADESWSWGGNGTPPGIMYPRPKINPFCSECHPKEKIDPEPHKSFFAGAAKEKYCTDCHGDHRLGKRQCKWK